jgi:predicted nucleic acid-binding protein
VLVRKAGRPRADAQAAILTWADAFSSVETSREAVIAATGLATDHNLGIRDAVVLVTSARAGCRLLLSEDLQDGFSWNGVTVTNPFAMSLHPLLAALIDR